MKEKYMTIEEASRVTTLAKSTLYSYVFHRAIPFIRIGGRIVFEEEVLQKWMRRKEVKEVRRK